MKILPGTGRWKPAGLTEGLLRPSCQPLHHASHGPPPRAGEELGRRTPQTKWGPVSPPAPTVPEVSPRPEGRGPARRAVSGETRGAEAPSSPGLPVRAEALAVRRGAGPEGPAGRSSDPPPCPAIASACAPALPVRKASARAGNLPNGGGSFEPPFPRLACGPRGRPPRRRGSGWKGSGVAAFASPAGLLPRLPRSRSPGFHLAAAVAAASSAALALHGPPRKAFRSGCGPGRRPSVSVRPLLATDRS